jgi:hypothetical protein
MEKAEKGDDLLEIVRMSVGKEWVSLNELEKEICGQDESIGRGKIVARLKKLIELGEVERIQEKEEGFSHYITRYRAAP